MAFCFVLPSRFQPTCSFVNRTVEHVPIVYTRRQDNWLRKKNETDIEKHRTLIELMIAQLSFFQSTDLIVSVDGRCS